ncbi:MAG: hypothetical protein B7Y96_10740 [Comamonadaceae bacterium 32-67-11]|nr:MAG: hypothetical protein B7Y96_10740 [Comamonadaceae bacterium 32-67-11]
MTREQIEHSINATDSEDALKYLPSLLVRKRYIGDSNGTVAMRGANQPSSCGPRTWRERSLPCK